MTPELMRWLTPDPAGFAGGMNLYAYVWNNPLKYFDPDGQFAFVIAIPLLWSAAEISAAIGWSVATVAIAWGGYELSKSVNQWADNRAYKQSELEQQSGQITQEEKNTNPFEGPVNEDIIAVDPKGNAIPVKEGNWLTGSEDGKWIQEIQPGQDPKGNATGLRKDGGHPKSPKHPDPRSWEPHAHVPGVANPDGTPWLPIH